MPHRFYDCQRWRNIRAFVLSQHPICECCRMKGVTTIATQVDHIVPITQGGNPTAKENLQSLCDTCHSRKTRKENQNEKSIVSSESFADKIIEKKTIIKRGRPKKVKDAIRSDISNDNEVVQDILHKDNNNAMAGGINASNA